VGLLCQCVKENNDDNRCVCFDATVVVIIIDIIIVIGETTTVLDVLDEQ